MFHKRTFDATEGRDLDDYATLSTLIDTTQSFAPFALAARLTNDRILRFMQAGVAGSRGRYSISFAYVQP